MMKNILKKRVLIILLCTTALLFASFNLFSCYGDNPLPQKKEVTTIFDNFPANDGIAVDVYGTVFAANYGQFVQTGGDGSTVLQANPFKKVFDTIASGLINPVGTAVDSEGTIYVSNANNFVSGEVTQLNSDGSKVILATIEGYPSGITVDEHDNLYIANYLKGLVHKIDTEGKLSVYAQDERLFGGVGIDFDNDGNLVVGNLITGDVLSINPSGQTNLVTTIPTVQQFSVIGYITYFKNHIYATVGAENRIYKISLETGEFEVFAGNGEAASTDGPVLEASLNRPNGITVDPYRKILYITEFGNRLRAISL
ncbi:hypothetical protein ABN763_13375 [Spongiivirga sp. MCCC 1A20706]|uniref:hypothetical protein n=1 Tax=Spongiivirga sp. MCCC 1A20706 TaxID=3160963 RepID=UPI003977548F